MLALSMGRFPLGVIPLAPSNLRGVGWRYGVMAAVAGPLWNAVGGADIAAGAVAPPTGVIMPEATIAGAHNTKGGTECLSSSFSAQGTLGREPRLRYHETTVTQRHNFAA